MTRPYLDRHRFVLGDASAHLGFLHCERLAARSHIHDWSVEAHFHEGLSQVLVFAGGVVEALIDHSPARIEGPAVLWLPALCSHAFRYPVGMQGWSITLPASDTARIAAEAPWLDSWIARPQVLSGPGLTETLLPLVARIEGESTGTSADRSMALEALFRLLLIEMGRGLAAEGAAATGIAGRKQQLVARFQRLVDETAPLPDVAALARRLSVTRTHLTRAIREVTGRTASEILAEQRVLRARRSLAFSAEPISAIAYELGFSSPSYFTRFLVARTGETPSAFRQRFRRGLSTG